MEIKKYIDRCNSTSSAFFILWKMLTPDLMTPQSCKCCIFWRGVFIGAGINYTAVILAMCGLYKAAAIYIAVVTIMALVLALTLADEEDDTK